MAANAKSSRPFQKPDGTLLLTASDVRRALDLPTCIDAVERAFALHGEGRSLPPAVLGIHADGGGFHVKAAGLELGRPYVATKINANFPANPVARSLPTIQGVVLLADGETGYPLALMDSMSITAIRTAAATAVAARFLSRPGADAAALIGCGAQALAQLSALACVRPVARATVFDQNPDRARRFAASAADVLGIPVDAAPSAKAACAEAHLVVTCTTARAPVLVPGDVALGTFVAAVGADNPEKNEMDPKLMARGRVVVDSLAQCADIGDLRAAIAAGAMTREDVAAELAEIAAGIKPLGWDAGVVTIFDSTGVALQDVAAAVAVYEKLRGSAGMRVLDFAT